MLSARKCSMCRQFLTEAAQESNLLSVGCAIATDA
jgi:hypothetical protein